MKRKDLSVIPRWNLQLRKGVLTTKTRLALKTKVDHKLIDLLLFIKELEIYLGKNNTFPYRLSNNALIAASVP